MHSYRLVSGYVIRPSLGRITQRNRWGSKQYLHYVYYGKIRRTEVSDCFTLCIFLGIASRIIWHILPETLNSRRSVTHTLTPLWNTCPITGELSPSLLPSQQDGAIFYTPYDFVPCLQTCWDRIISREAWSPCLPDLNPCDSDLLEMLKNTVYRHNRRTADDLKENIQNVGFQFASNPLPYSA